MDDKKTIRTKRGKTRRYNLNYDKILSVGEKGEKKKIIKSPEESLDYCIKDYKHHHYWELIGNIEHHSLIYRCIQCLKSKLVRIKFIDGNCVEEYDFKESK